VFYHIPTDDFRHACVGAGYQDQPDSKEFKLAYEIGVDVPAKNGDFGKKGKGYGSTFDCTLLPILKQCNVDGVFAGDQHEINTSILWEGIRFTMGLKTGTYDSHDKNALGGTLIRLNGRDFTVEHQYCEKR
ncbi:MAG: hypothetical protein IKY52_05030, partial [Clostridia bacterium]|nr:hypothetical protein [Clostridia bacterium]